MRTPGTLLTHALFAGAFAAPAPATVQGPGHFTVNVKYNDNFKHTPHQSDGAVRRDDGDGTIIAHNSATRPDAEYYAEILVGTLPQTINLLFDTGSSDLWLFGADVHGAVDAGQQKWNHTASSTAKLIKGGKWSIHYLDGSGGKGTIYKDTVSVGSVNVNDQGVEYATHVDPMGGGGNILGSPVSGIVGFGFDGSNTASPKQKTLFSNMKDNLTKPLFTVDLKHKANGTFGFGFIDDSKYTGSIAYSNVDSSDGFWGWTSNGYAVGDGEFVSLNITGITDTGGSTFKVPTDVFSAYTKAIADYTGSFDCDTKLPDFYFGAGGDTKIKVDGEHIKAKNDKGKCYLKMVDGGSKATFGSPAMAGAFVVFEDGDKGPRIGWANSK